MIITRDHRFVSIPDHAVATPTSLPKCAACCMAWENHDESIWCRLMQNTIMCPGPGGDYADVKEPQTTGGGRTDFSGKEAAPDPHALNIREDEEGGLWPHYYAHYRGEK